jgi:hypothetical protein
MDKVDKPWSDVSDIEIRLEEALGRVKELEARLEQAVTNHTWAEEDLRRHINLLRKQCNRTQDLNAVLNLAIDALEYYKDYNYLSESNDIRGKAFEALDKIHELRNKA